MKRNLTFIICCSFLFLYPAFSQAATGLYWSINAGLAIRPDSDVNETSGDPFSNFISYSYKEKYDAGYTIGGAVGIMMENLRLEGEMSYQTNDVDKLDGMSINGDVDILTFLVNGYFDFDTGGPIKPYITAGLGFSNVDESEPGYFSEDDNILTYQVGAGVGIALNEITTLDCRYRYLGASDFEYSYSVAGTIINGETEIASHNLTVGIRMAF